MKSIRKILLFPILLILIISGIIIYETTIATPEVLGCAVVDTVPFCGTTNPILTEDQKKGREIFNSNCAACHKLDAKSTGPALRNVDSLVFVKWLINKNHKVDSTKIEKLGIDFHQTMFTERVNKKDAVLILDYCSSERY
ncbi:hypothetical protein C4F50_21405 [Flavobacterium sp. KB82]|uniref:Cytochrome c domain-containing protein n=1 Tax=Flavobacterium hungaricum TaxID=2082725 RepID=A0ABR9TQ80_9FLAO|nr:hypothetical protein [Flavobacterium hungaricum]